MGSNKAPSLIHFRGKVIQNSTLFSIRVYDLKSSGFVSSRTPRTKELSNYRRSCYSLNVFDLKMGLYLYDQPQRTAVRCLP